MNDPFQQLPVLPVVIPLGILIFAILLWRLQARQFFSLPRAAVAAALGTYVAGIIANTVFPIYINKPARTEPWTPSIALIPFFDYEVRDAVINVLVFVPLGILVSLLLTRPTWWKVMTTALCASVAIELTQLAVQGLFAGGHVADVNDLIFNVIGAAFGVALLRIITQSQALTRIVDLFRWAPATRDASTTWG